MFYWARLYTEDLKRGEGYEKLCPAYSLVFTNFDVLPSRLTDYVNSFSIRLDKQPYEELTNHLKIVILELSKFKCDQLQNLDKKASWRYVLKESEKIGKKEGIEEVVLNMLENGFDLDSISKAAKLSKAEIKKIQKR